MKARRPPALDRWRWAARGCWLLLALAGCATAPRAGTEPLLPRLAVSDVVLEPVAGGADTGRRWFRTLLADQATASARRAAVEHRLAAVVESGGGPGEGYQLTGRLSVPSILPSDLRGSRAAFKSGVLALAHLELRDAGGVLVTSADASLRWKDVRWTTGGPKTRRARRVDAVLLDAADRAMNRAAVELVSRLGRPAASE